MGGVPQIPHHASPEVVERLRRRYPGPRLPRTVLVALVAAGTVIACGWLIWVASMNSRPDVSAQVSAFTVESDQSMSVTVTIDRRDPRQPAVCTVVAQAVDFQPVAQARVEAGAGDARLVDRTEHLVTLRRATSARVVGCESG